MNYLKINVLLLMFTSIFLLSCRESPVAFNRIEYVIPGHINIKIDDLSSRFAEIKTDPESSIYIVIVLYSYSSGAETISFSGGDDMTTVTAGGRLKALVKVMDGKKILRAEFAEGRGNSREDMLSSLLQEIKLRLVQ
ncbi:MAG: hypothetical protein CVV49_04290 [Spirochaetae bacterium HGW-Spirochaetae-5]|nr:MAG: hypothetical protein CVV49_04290 [Spirochaetae bacterium HGW-Spirochaetae-5]